MAQWLKTSVFWTATTQIRLDDDPMAKSRLLLIIMQNQTLHNLTNIFINK
jgi:hypothetical protein